MHVIHVAVTEREVQVYIQARKKTHLKDGMKFSSEARYYHTWQTCLQSSQKSKNSSRLASRKEVNFQKTLFRNVMFANSAEF
jgi:hypothetical protein